LYGRPVTEPVDRSRVDDLRDLLDQLQAGIMVCEEILDEELPLWDAPKRGRRKNPDSAARNAWGLMSIAWMNVGSILVALGVEPWSIPPLVSRAADGTGNTVMEFGPDGHLEINPADGAHLMDRQMPPGAVRIVDRPVEPRYTLAEAREILQVCQEHAWDVETGEHGAPVAVVCKNCQERRQMR
jgi:hypothetical protein